MAAFRVTLVLLLASFLPLDTAFADVSPSTSPSPPLADAQLRAINHRFVQVFASPSVAVLEDIVGQDFLSTGNDGAWLGRSDFIARVGTMTSVGGVSYRDVDVRLFGSVAVVHGLFESIGGEAVARVRYTDVFQWHDDAWRLVSAQNTPLRSTTAIDLRTAEPVGIAEWTGSDPEGDDEQVLRELNEAYVQAFRAADVAWYDAHLADDYLVVYGDGSLNDRKAALADFSKPTFKTYFASFPVDKVSIRRFDDVALIHAENAYERVDGRRGVDRYTDIWIKRDGRWQCVAAHITNHVPPR